LIASDFVQECKKVLPEVSLGVIKEILTAAYDSKRIRMSWEEMIRDNPALFTCITELAVKESLIDQIRGEMFLRGAMCVWESLRVQEEINEMNEEWGVD
jgi:hypothetical protein